MSSDYVLSSEQALDDYFSALLDEESDTEIETDLELINADMVEDDAPALELQPQSVSFESTRDQTYAEIQAEAFEVPNLEDVQKLLSQLESTDVVAELDLDSIMEQNTAEIATLQDDIIIQNNDIKLSVDDEPSIELTQEVQSWDVTEPVEDDVIVETEAVVEVADAVTFNESDSVIDITQPESIEPQIIESETVDVQTDIELETQAGSNRLDNWQATARSEDFQVLYFEVNGVTFAVPLDELGGIHQISELSHIIGKPSWYLGLQMNKDSQLDVVDSAKWVMAEKLVNDDHKDNYQYIVMLGESSWGLASTELMGTELLNTDKVRWREQVGKRPWLAGMVKEKMCALIHVEAMVAMLNAGLDVKALD